MVLALTWQKLVTALVSVILLIIAGFAVYDGALSAEAIWARRNLIGTILLVTLGLLNIPIVFAVVHSIFLARYWMFPRLDGKWKAQLCSNWPRIERTFNAARNGGPTFNSITGELTREEEDRRYVEADVTITSSLFLIVMTLRPVGSQRASRTRFVRPLWHSPDRPELSYVYEQEDQLPVSLTDAPEHFGAGIIRYDAETEELFGKYWNDRRADAGLNTAGTIRLTRVMPRCRWWQVWRKSPKESSEGVGADPRQE
ncbi:MAG: hypothetical protein B7Z20_00240 [Sphingobium sp. 32-64-5]|nr:MAG: hypothetical protein B7Z20_00240 [Sphingobium sp. 32-64-5]